MRRIYHLVLKSDWDRQPEGPYSADSLAGEGFIHCSNREQVEKVANLFFATAAELLLLTIDVGQLDVPLRDEDIGTGECFPHIYGMIPRPAIVAVETMRRDAHNRWMLP